MSLTQTDIFKKFQNKNLDKSSALSLLISILENADNLNDRLKTLEIFERLKIRNIKLFKVLENLLVSDLNENIRCEAARVLDILFLEQAYEPLKWVMQNEKSLKCLIFFLTILGNSNSNSARLILLAKLYEIKKKKYQYNLKSFDSFDNKSNLEISKLIINFLVISSLKIKFGYVKYCTNNQGMITELNLSNIDYQGIAINRLEKSLDSILALSYLKNLDLSNNHLKLLPEEINKSNSIEVLDLSFNKLSRIPNSFTSLSNLKLLNLKSNHIRYLSKSISTLSSLHTLILRDNFLDKFPKSIGDLENLKLLDIHHNKFNKIPSEIGNLKNLIELELGWNKIEYLPESLKKLTKLQKLSLGRNFIKKIPPWINSLYSLKELNLYENDLHELSDNLNNLSQLERLNLRNNKLNSVPECISSLYSLKALNLSWNNLIYLPEWIGDLRFLEELNLWGNKLRDVPDSILKLQNIRKIYLNFNKINELSNPLKKLAEQGVFIKI